MNYEYFLTLFCIIFFLSIALTKVNILLAERINFKSIANERSSHFEPVANGGGLSFLLITVLGLFFFKDFQGFSVENSNYFLIASFLIGIIGYIDDLKDISPLPRFLFQVFAASLVILSFSRFPHINFFDFIISNKIMVSVFGIIFLVWLTNLYNFMDGIDGLATLQGIFILFSYFFIIFVAGDDLLEINQEKLFFLHSIIILMSALFGFLIFNFPNSSIFMGDVGSSFLGFYLASMGIYAASNNWIYFWTFTIIWSIFLVDATVTLLSRIWRRDKWYDAHRTHAYQKINQIYMRKIKNKYDDESDIRTVSHKFVCFFYSGVNLFWVFPLSLLSIKYPQFGFMIAFICFLPIVIGSLYVEAGKQINTVARNEK